MIESSNSRDDKIRYLFKGRIVNGKPVYENENINRAFWFDGDTGLEGDWMNGKLSNLDENKLDYGYMISDSFAQCPNAVPRWKEYYNDAWRVNPDATVNCVSNQQGIALKFYTKL